MVSMIKIQESMNDLGRLLLFGSVNSFGESWYSFGNSWRKTLKIINSGGSTNEILEKGLTAAALLAVTAVTLTACGGSSESN